MSVSSVTLTEASASIAYSFKLVWEFAANLSCLSLDRDAFERKLKQNPMQGRYRLDFKDDELSGELRRLCCLQSDLSAGDLGERVTVDLRLEWVSNGEEVTLAAKSFGPDIQPRKRTTPGGGAYDGWALDVDLAAIGAGNPSFHAVVDTVQSYRFTAKIAQKPPRSQNETEIGDFETATRLAGTYPSPDMLLLCLQAH